VEPPETVLQRTEEGRVTGGPGAMEAKWVQRMEKTDGKGGEKEMGGGKGRPKAIKL